MVKSYFIMLTLLINLFPYLANANQCPPSPEACAFGKPSTIRVHIVIHLDDSIKSVTQNNSLKIFAHGSCGTNINIDLEKLTLNEYFPPGDFSIYFCKSKKLLKEQKYDDLKRSSIIDCNIDSKYEIICKKE